MKRRWHIDLRLTHAIRYRFGLQGCICSASWKGLGRRAAVAKVRRSAQKATHESAGLRTPRPPRFSTCVYSIVVLTSAAAPLP